MQPITLYHNPRCSKSRAALALLEAKNHDINIVEYLKQPPSTEQIINIFAQLSTDKLTMIRHKEPLFKELGLSLDTDKNDYDWANILSQYPILIERPIVIANGQAAIGRHIENITAIL